MTDFLTETSTHEIASGDSLVVETLGYLMVQLRSHGPVVVALSSSIDALPEDVQDGIVLVRGGTDTFSLDAFTGAVRVSAYDGDTEHVALILNVAPPSPPAFEFGAMILDYVGTTYRQGPEVMAFSDDGTKGLWDIGGAFYDFELTTPWDFSTLVQGDSGSAISFGANSWVSDDGLKFATCAYALRKIHVLTLQQPYKLSGATVQQVSMTDRCKGLDFSADQTIMYLGNQEGAVIIAYQLAGPMDFSSKTEIARFDTTAEGPDPSALQFNNDGTKLIVGFSNPGKLVTYALSTPFDLDTMTVESVVTDFGNPIIDRVGDFHWTSDGSRLVLQCRGYIYQFINAPEA